MEKYGNEKKIQIFYIIDKDEYTKNKIKLREVDGYSIIIRD
jgi:hypothetical protein